jgi:hypothetical protein
MTRPIADLAAYLEYAGALPVPLGHARPLAPAPRLEAVDVPVAVLEARAESDWLAFRRQYAADAHARQQLHTEPTPEEAS